MTELTDEQIDKAVKIASATRTPELSWNGSTGENGILLWRETMRAVAPFLQLPWNEPTEDEAKVIHSTDFGLNLTATFDQCKWNVLREFVGKRNEALLPKPAPPRGFEGWKIRSSNGNLRDVTELDVSKVAANFMRENPYPKPADPRIDLLDRTLCGFMNSLNNTEERTKAAKAILTALDEVK